MYFLHLVCYPGFEANFSGQSVGVTDRAGVDDSKLVPTSSSAARRQTDFTTAKKQSLVPASQSNPPTHEGSSSSGRVEVIWQSLGDRGFSDEASRLITSSWTSGTDKQYNSALKQWCSWCTQRKVGITGIYNVRTPIPRYSTTWDVTKVTTYLATLFPLDQLSLTNLTFKTVMLCALSSTQREQTLCALDLKNKRESGTCLSFVMTERLKTSKPGKSTEVTFECLPDQPQICTKCTVMAYILRTAANRCPDPNLCVSRLFISYVRPHKPVTTDTLAR